MSKPRRTQAQRLASIDATVAASKDRDSCDPRGWFNRRHELSEEAWPEYRAEFDASFLKMVTAALAVCQEWQLDRDASEEVLRERGRGVEVRGE